MQKSDANGWRTVSFRAEHQLALETENKNDKHKGETSSTSNAHPTTLPFSLRQPPRP